MAIVFFQKKAMMMKIIKHISLSFLVGLTLLQPVALYGQTEVVNLPDSNKILCAFSLPSYSIKDTILPIEYENTNLYKYIRIYESSAGFIDSVGFPELPFLMYNFEIPYNANNIELSMSEIRYEYFNLENHILPHQNDIEKNGTNETHPFIINDFFYSSNNTFMTVDIQVMDTFIVRGVKGIRLALMPFKYNPYRKQLQVLKSANIEIRYQAGQFRQKQAQSDTWENIHKSIFVNHCSNLRAPAAEKYLILTLPQYEDAIQYFANYKQSLGMDVSVHSLTQNQNTPTSIKQIIQNYYDNIETRPDYILLVGDHPYLPAYSGVLHEDSIDNPITDVPYAFLEGNDYYRDALIGRWPVHSSLDVQTITNKTIYMEMNMHLCEKKAVFIAGAEDNSTMQRYFEKGHEDAIEYSFDPDGYLCTQLNQPNRTTALSYLNDDPLFYIYSGHGSYTSWVVITSDFPNHWNLNYSFISNSSHKTYPMTFAFACKTGNFADANISIAESWINNRNGAVAYFGSSVSTMVVSDYRIEKKLFGDAFFDEETIGGITALGMKRYYDAFFTLGNRAKRYMKSYNLMGDPSFKVRGLGCNDSYYVERMKLKNGDNQYYRASTTITFEGDNQAGYGSELVLRAGQEIVFKDGFIAAPGSETTAQIEECIDNRTMNHYNENESSATAKRKLMNVPSFESNSFDMKVYPNPTSDIVNIEFNNLEYAPICFEIYDVFGKLLFHREIVKTIDNNKITFDISNYTSGCYYVVATMGKEKEYKCIIKQ